MTKEELDKLPREDGYVYWEDFYKACIESLEIGLANIEKEIERLKAEVEKK